jgi:demethylmenaquinone methyltransferase/2-methoxy-6-polyprenyl-1,4-benzoquinol methylase
MTTATKPLYEMFNTVPPRYDLVNHVVTLGFDTGWRRAAARACIDALSANLANATKRTPRFLDLCCGTADLAVQVSRAAKGVEVTGLDYSQAMLDIAAAKSAAAGVGAHFIVGEAAALPFANGFFDCAGISFAFRNLTYKNPLVRKHLSEALRIIKPGGRFVIVESSQPASLFIRRIFHLFVRTWVRWAGTWISGNKGAYRYLSESVSRYYTSPELRALLLEAGFREVAARPLLFGAAAVHVATK